MAFEALQGLRTRICGPRALGPIVHFFIFTALFTSCFGARLGSIEQHHDQDSADSALCRGPLSIAPYLDPQLGCYAVQGQSFDTVFHLDRSRLRTPTIPCNSVQLVSMANQSTFDFVGAINKVSTGSIFDPALLTSVIQNPEDADESTLSHPAIASPQHQAMVDLIRDARKTIFFNAIIFGGRWGSELVREMILKSQNDGVEVVILRDTRNSFAFASELVPVWEKLVEFGRAQKSFTVLQADIHTRTLSGIPFGFDRITSLFEPYAKEGISLSGRSDHSKILIIDGFESHPAMLVSSKNPSDYNLLNYDESALVRGPAAAAAQVAFMSDIRLAEKLAKKKTEGSPSGLTLDDQSLIDSWYKAESEIRGTSKRLRLIEPMGTAGVEISENNSDDSVRNAEMGVLHMLESANESIRMYHFLTYNPAVARALARAAIRLGPQNVKVLADATLTFPLNVTFMDMLSMELNSLGSTIDPHEFVRWRRTAPPMNFPKKSGRIGITQQQHAKSIIVDGQSLYLGSTNFDFASLAGAFREFSIKISDSTVSNQSAALFDSIWNDRSEWNSTNEILATGGPTSAKVPSEKLRRLIVNTIRTEQARIGSLVPENIVVPCSKK